uniref:Alpha-L-arabinofuranosidase B catalytic domain-containing protein n=1 Tax=Haptolina ericina TaxID=156174 RepID=A0A7S3EY55_9EUKA|mmetsp:Transcript_36239/g.82193  ORF Transcript_36239/g.82193 Transcript_36239/m.82193 type:complete len:109 (+) Transcript_36239:3-329(+)
MVKGDSGNHYSLLAGDAQTPDSLQVLYDGPRPVGYEIMHKGGAIVLGIGGDNSPWAAGTFYEGVMTAGYASSETDAAVMANIVAAGYAPVGASDSTGRGRMVERAEKI